MNWNKNSIESYTQPPPKSDFYRDEPVSPFDGLVTRLRGREEQANSEEGHKLLARKRREEEDARYAGSLMEKRSRESLHPQEVEWLTEWQASHKNPDVEDYNVGRSHAEDLGVGMGGLLLLGARSLDEYGSGNVNVAGGWCFRVGSTEDDNGWHRGWWSEVHGLDAFMEAMGLDAVPEASEPLGPFYDEHGLGSDLLRAYEELTKRLLAMLVIVSRVALQANPEAQKQIELQEAAFAESLGDTNLEELRRFLEGIGKGT